MKILKITLVIAVIIGFILLSDPMNDSFNKMAITYAILVSAGLYRFTDFLQNEFKK